MNLEDVIDAKYGLQQDEWSLSKPVVGEDNQIEVIGWSGYKRTAKVYILKCHKCSEDSELFEDGVFRSVKGNLIKGNIPCGCARAPQWSNEQWVIKARRKAEDVGFGFLGIIGEWKGIYTKIQLVCPKHGQWDSGTLSTLINQGQGCPKCKSEKLSELHSKPYTEMIQSFFASGAFHPDTKFWRSKRKDSKGYFPYWNVYCPECNNEAEAASNSLQKGCRPCLCSPSRQQQAYINFIKDNDSPIAIKFGIANISHTRVRRQDSKSIYNISNHLVYEFPTKQDCRAAELRCKLELQCGILSKEQMEDGWTETTYLSNLDKIIEIYTKHNGVIYEP